MLGLKIKYLPLSILLSLLSIAVILFINYQITKEYLRVNGKTRALFGIKEILQFGYQYCVAVAGIVALGFAILSPTKEFSSTKKWMTILLSILSIALVFLRIWRLFI